MTDKRYGAHISEDDKGVMMKKEDYVKGIYQMLLLEDSDMPSLKYMKFFPAMSLHNHLKTLDIKPRESDSD